MNLKKNKKVTLERKYNIIRKPSEQFDLMHAAVSDIHKKLT